jgi:urease accessory protein
MPHGTALPASARLVVDGVAEVGFRRREGATRLAHLFQRDPLRVLLPTPDPGEPVTAVLVTTSGGLVGGDRLRIDVEVGAAGVAQVATQAAEKVYRSAGPDTRIEMRFAAGEGALLEYLPHETILFDGARLRRHARVELSQRARFLGGEILVFGRAARGERLTSGLVHDAWEVAAGGVPIWADTFHLEGDLPRIWADPAALDGAEAVATLFLAGPGAAALLPNLRAHLAAGAMRAGATIVNGVLLARFLGPAGAVRRGWAEAASLLRAEAAGSPRNLPRLWHV